jgi:polysaccharide deacetylase 2 family uncharacterized protein YibQ
MAGKSSSAGAAAGLLLLGLLAWWALRPPTGGSGQAPVVLPGTPTAVPAPSDVPVPAPKGRLAIVIDDWGYQAQPVQRLKGFKFRLTAAILPGLAHSKAAAEAAFAGGNEVILHCPMQALGPIKREKGTLLKGMPADEAKALLQAHWDAVPHLSGLNNHEGSAGSTDRALMDVVAGFLKAKGAFFLDSVTSAQSAIPQAAKAAGVPWAQRRIFLDNVDQPDAVEAQLRQAAKLALKNGSCIAIGHPRKATLDVLERLAPELQAAGLQLVKVSELVHP